jgi:hypothetical protein
MKQQAVVLTVLAILALTPLAAQDDNFDDGSFFREITEGDGETQTEPEAARPVPEIGGELRLANRYTLDYGTPGDTGISSVPGVRLNLDYAGTNTDVVISLEIEQETSFEDPAALIDEAYLRYYGGGFDLEAGYMKVVWGPGDGTHAVNVLNPIDYSDFINPSYLERLTAAPMFKLNVPVNGGLMELVYLPLFSSDYIPQEGAWAPAEARALSAGLEAAIALASAGDDFTALQMQENAVREETTADLGHSQLAFRFTKSVGAADLGAVYYLGYFKQPTVDKSGIVSAAPHVSLTYDRVQMIGIEGSGVLGAFNLRGEAGWYVSDDFQGDDPAVRNSELRWVGGFDCNLPLSNLNLNIQETGSLIMDYQNISAGDDVQRDTAQTSNRLIVNLSDSWNNEKILPEITFIYGLEDQDWRAGPELTVVAGDNIGIQLAGGIYGGDDDGFFGQYDGNDFVELTVSYAF